MPPENGITATDMRDNGLTVKIQQNDRLESETALTTLEYW